MIRSPKFCSAAGFTMVETIVAIAVLGIGVASTIGALTKINSFAAMSRNSTGAYTVLMNQVDLFQSMSPFNPQKNQIPVESPLPTGNTYPTYDMSAGTGTRTHDISVDGKSYNVPVYEYKDQSNNVLLVVNAQGPYSQTGYGLTVTITDLNLLGTTPSSGPYQAVFTIKYKYLNRDYTYSVSSIRSSDI
jgi:prepilin-type N-terminal cleavage/methylation domain-containing protein